MPFIKPTYAFTGNKNYQSANTYNTEPLVAGNDYNYYQSYTPTPRPPAVIQIGKPIRPSMYFTLTA
jgi:hypothetical protein